MSARDRWVVNEFALGEIGQSELWTKTENGPSD